MESIHEFINVLLRQTGVSDTIAFTIKGFLFVLMLVLLCVLVNWIAKLVIVKIISRVVLNSKNKWDDVFLEKKVFHRLSHLAPVMVIYWAGPAFMSEFPKLVGYTYLATNAYIIFMVLIIVYALLDALGAIYETYDISRSRPIKGYLQVTKIIGGMIAGILILSIILDKSPIYFFTGLGAITAILILIFRDTILGFVAGIQVTTNNLVQIGDWIEMPKYGADGDVIDISLHTVRIQNFDRTITTIPTYALVSDSFKNWRGMVMTGGRRIMRDVYIDIKSIKFCDEEMLDRFSKIQILREYIEQKKEEIEKYNKEYNIDPEVPVNGRRMTNIGTFRAYITRYLGRHPKIHKGLISMVRQMPSGEKGVPLQVYAFTNDTNWVNYEAIQADIFDHILSVATYFDLKIFQFPSELTLKIPDYEQLRNLKGE
jgi:miniconductance mechanosensitive channel